MTKNIISSSLTGKTSHRINWLGKSILQVEVKNTIEYYDGSIGNYDVLAIRDATVEDRLDLVSIWNKKRENF